MSRERDVRNALQTALLATGSFSNVWLSGLPEDFGHGVSDLTAAAIEPVASEFSAGWDSALGGSLDYTTTLRVTLLARHPDPQLRDELVEQLLNYLNDAVNGQALVPGFTVPQKTSVTSWQWQAAVPPERRIVAVVGISYLVEGWDNFDVSE
jgi:hypothetical protein